MLPVDVYRPRTYPPPGKHWIPWGDRQLDKAFASLSEEAHANLTRKNEHMRKLHEDRAAKLGLMSVKPTLQRYSISDSGSVYDDAASMHEVPRPQHLPVFPDSGSEMHSHTIPVPPDDEFDYEDAVGDIVAVREPVAEAGAPSLMEKVKGATVSTLKYMGTNLKNNIVDTAHLVKNTAVTGSQIVGALGPQVVESTDQLIRLAGPPVVYGTKAAFQLGKFFVKSSWTLADVLLAIEEAKDTNLQLQDDQYALGDQAHRRGRNDTPPRRGQASSSSNSNLESYDSVDEWKQHSRSSKTYLMEQIYKRDGWGKVLGVADDRGYHSDKIDFRQKLLRLSANDLSEILLHLDGKA